ncbi:hypothetical protein K491DRAFT_97807 [Lophiostoma macrostomum CBS 122681]|uniref:Macro domain-containing protein n=1 Tax=Lophiostoma macrostomum CBS 122681 TaxID=1314788 RepID=A0A6A6SXS2_9PLEO|nr:hypothetical protein K491DRAFT_97807 [Lophiostoma macrostomum CBS 122681]
MAAIRFSSAAVHRGFQNLISCYSSAPDNLCELLDSEALDDEFGRFRVWVGNLGALQKGHSSLDYRLRESPLLSSNTLKLLKELEENIVEVIAVLSGVRLPYEQQAKPEDSENEDDEFFSEDEDDDSILESPRTELGQRFRDIVDIIDNLYKLSVRIRQPTLRARSLKAATYRPKDRETGVDLLESYAVFDIQHTRELVRHLRSEHTEFADIDKDPIIDRLAKAVTLRRRQFKYWRRHRDKLGTSALLEDEPAMLPAPVGPHIPHRFDGPEVEVGNIGAGKFDQAASEKTGRTLLSGTEATRNPNQQSLDDIVDSKSVTSYATTVRDLDNHEIELPPPPKTAEGGEKDFECPYCFIICPSRYGKGRSWRTHLLQDLQPYLCTYPECENSEHLFRSRREWSDHEASHRKAFRCPEHPTSVYHTTDGLRDHIRQVHADSVPEYQLESIVKVGETSTVDLREKCPICCVTADMEGGLKNHIANHLERLACFSLPNCVADDDSDGTSGAGTRGGSTTSNSSQSGTLRTSSRVSSHSTRSNSSLRGDDSISAEQGQLSANALGSLPNAIESRVDIFLSDKIKAVAIDQQDTDDSLADLDEHVVETEAFRSYLHSLPGSLSVRFMRRYGSWRGSIKFQNEDFASSALGSFNHSRFPDIKLQRGIENRTSVKFSLPRTAMPETATGAENASPTRQTALENENEESSSSASLSYTKSETPGEGRLRILTTSEIQTLHTLYRSRQLQQRDQSYAPNDAYNGLISYCYHDITRLQVECIVNSANRALKITRPNETLNYIVHRNAGPGLQKECKAHGRINAGAVALTSAYNLPCDYVMHAARPHFTGSSKSMGKYNVLTQCYRSALRKALDHNVKTIAFPCLGAGGCGFPSKTAARIALQEVREWLDAHSGQAQFKKIIFCVFSDADRKAYMDFLPVFFPPTHGDLENIMAPTTSPPRVSFATLHIVQSQVDVTAQHLVGFSEDFPAFPKSVLSELTAISSCLQSVGRKVTTSNESDLNMTDQTVDDINLLCAILQSICGDVVELIEQTKYADKSNTRANQTIWEDYNSHVKDVQGLDLPGLLVLCNDFVQILDDVIVRNGIEPYEMATIRMRLGNYRLKKTGEDHKQVRDNFEETLYERDFQERAVKKGAVTDSRTDAIKPYHIPSLSRLYQLGDLEYKPTFAKPNQSELTKVALIREDITRLDVDVLVSSTDPDFSGAGTLDRLVFQKGGNALRRECARFGTCKEGDIKITQGGLLHARHVIHVVMFEVYRTGTKEYLRKIYREILLLASSLKATTIAIPAIGTGALNYPRRDCAALAMEEVKRFLESDDSGSLEKIIFCVYGSNDEHVYKSTLPIFFPPIASNVNKALSSGPGENNLHSSSAETQAPGASPIVPKRTLFGSVGDAFRNVRFGKQPATTASRSLRPEEVEALRNFENHAERECSTCSNMVKLYNEGRELCADGYAAAQCVLKYLYMESSRIVYSTDLEGDKRIAVKIPPEFPKVWNLLILVEGSYRDEYRSRPFVSPNQPYDTVHEGETIPPWWTNYNPKVEIPPRHPEPEKIIARILSWHEETKELGLLDVEECNVYWFPGKVEVYESDQPRQNQSPLLSLKLTPSVPLIKSGVSDVALKAPSLPDSRIRLEGEVRFRCRSADECEKLFQKLKIARRYSWQSGARESVQGEQASAPRNKDEGRKVLVSELSTSQEDSLADKILTLLRSLPAPEDSQGLSTEELSAALEVSVEDVANAAEELRHRELIFRTVETSTWLPTKRTHKDGEGPSQESHKLYTPILRRQSSDTSNIIKPDMANPTPINITDYVTYLDETPDPDHDPDPTSPSTITHPRPTTPDLSQPFPIPPGARWTKIDRRLVNAQALEEVNERFEQQEAHNVVLRVLKREDIVRLAERTREIRKGREELREFARRAGEAGDIRESDEKEVVEG